MRTGTKHIALPFLIASLAGAGLLPLACSAPRAGTSGPAQAAGQLPPVRDLAFLDQWAATNRFRLGQPGAFTVAPQGDGVFFLRANGPRSFTQDLWYFDAASGQERPLLTAEQILAGNQEHLTAEELARRERLRMTSRGIASYALSEDGTRLLVPLSGRLFVIDVTDRAAPKVRELPAPPAFPIDPRFSPDGRKVAAVCEDELYALDLTANTWARLTSGAGGAISNATAEFVAQEEMDRQRGYWFSPDAQRVIFQQTNTTGMETFHIADPVEPSKPPQTWPYPRAGKANAQVRLAIAPTTPPTPPAPGAPNASPTWVNWDAATFPYLARVNWPANAPLTILVQNREQTRQQLLKVDPDTGATSLLLEETDPAWINLEGDFPKWLPDGSGFLWMTEQGARGEVEGWRLELRKPDGSHAYTVVRADQRLIDFIALDPDAQSVVVSRSNTAVGNELLRYPLRTRRAPTPLPGQTGAPADHAAAIPRKGPLWVLTRNALDGSIAWTVYKGDQPVGSIRSIAEQPRAIPRVEHTSVQVGQARLNAAVIRPSDFVPGRKYPVINYVYGGPHSNQVNAPARAYLIHQFLADQGFIVVTLDARGTPRRGREWERVIKYDIIGIPLQEQADGTLALCARYPEMDRERIGITGWSFGGYFSAMATMRRPDVFKAGVAGAPVCDWRDYDTHYTERYLGLPQSNAAGYDAGNVLSYAKDLRVPLLIIHGTADDNVYFLHSLKMTQALFRAGKDFEFLPLAGFTHMVPDPSVTRNLWGRIAGFFIKTLQPAPQP
jgi:dipeptidyl-peptidase-4